MWGCVVDYTVCVRCVVGCTVCVGCVVDCTVCVGCVVYFIGVAGVSGVAGAAKHPKHSKFAITDIQEKPVNIFLLYFSSRNNFSNLGFLAKVFVPVQSITPWLTVYQCWSCIPSRRTTYTLMKFY